MELKQHILADNLRMLRSQLMLSQSKLSVKMEISFKQYQSYEEARCEPNINTLKAIAEFHGLTMDYLCFTKIKTT